MDTFYIWYNIVMKKLVGRVYCGSGRDTGAGLSEGVF